MEKILRGIRQKLPLALKGIIKTLSIPRYALFAFAIAVVFAIFLYLLINSGVYWPLLTSRLSLADKAGVIGMLARDMAVAGFTTFSGALMLVVSVLQGVAFAVMVYTMRRNKRVDMETMGEGGIVMFAAVLGLGCVPCGTSLILPILTFFCSSSAYAAANTASMIVLVIAFGLTLFTLYRLGYVAYAHNAIEPERRRKKHETITNG